MARRRYISTEISLDPDVDELAQESDFAALLYTWMLPHVGEDATISGNPKRIIAEVIPHRRDKTVAEVQDALDLMERCGLFECYDRSEQVIYYPVESFYKYQSNISTDKRRTTNSREQQRTAENSTSLSLSSSLSVSSSSSVSTGEEVPNIPRPKCFTDTTVSRISKALVTKYTTDVMLPEVIDAITDTCDKRCSGLHVCGSETALDVIAKTRIAGKVPEFIRQERSRK